MTHKHATLHPAMTAIAAAIALASTPLLAQTADPAVATTPALGTPAPSAAEPVAPAPVTDAPAAADPLAPKTTATTIHKATAPKTAAAHSTHVIKTETKTVTKTTRPLAAAPAATALAPASPAPLAQPLPVQPEVAATPVVAPVDQPPAPAEATSSKMLPIAGAVGLGILLLVGAGIAASRRRRRVEMIDDQDVYADTPPEAVADPVIADTQPAIVEPAFVAAPTAMAPIDPDAETDADLTPVEGPTTEVPEDFDLSRFGPNVRAAYCGPTVDNPSLSLKHRLRKATAMDQMERNAAEAEETEAATPAATDQSDEDFMLSGARKPTTRPAFIN